MKTIDCPKCEHEHEPCGSHEDDYGEWECEECGFKFNVEIEYDPSYYTTCVEHEFGEYALHNNRQGELVKYRFCIHCQKCELYEEGGEHDKSQPQNQKQRAMCFSTKKDKIL